MDRITPDLVMDVGANYGEIAFCTRYPTGSTAVLVEANARLIRLLEYGVSRRKDKGVNWRVVHAAASDRDGKANFFIDERSSGLSRLGRSMGGDALGRVELVDLIRLEDLDGCASARRVVFKIDVEGAEIKALRGMKRVLDQAEIFLGIVELNEQNLREAGASPSELWEFCRTIGHVALFDDRDRLVDLSASSWDEVMDIALKKGLRVLSGADLVLFKSVGEVASLAPPRAVDAVANFVKRVVP
ncbi:MAG: FkbM family methyltransferase [Aquisalimonadaceae bacterium]